VAMFAKNPPRAYSSAVVNGDMLLLT